MKGFIKGYKDSPVINLTEDFLGVKKYVDALCDFVLKCETPMTVSIQGEWGCGKTSFINLMSEKLHKCNNLILPNIFNTWQYSQFELGEQLPIVLIGKLIEGCGGNDEALSARIIGGFKKLLEVFGETADAAISSISPIDVSPSEMLLKILDKSNDSVKIIESLKTQFQKCIDDAIKYKTENNDGRMIVFIDDLDRLEPIKAVELLEVLKVFMDCNNCVFILAIDYEVIVQGVKQKYGENFSRGRQFFDKIIQLPYKMPIAQYDIKSFLEKSFEQMGIHNSDDSWNDFLENSKEIITCSVGYNPRGIKRLLNAFQLLQIVNEKENSESNIQKNNTEKNKSLLCLLAILCIQHKYESIYFYLVKSTESKNEFDIEQLLENLSRADELKSGEFAGDVCDTYSDCVKDIKENDEAFEDIAQLFKLIYENCKDSKKSFDIFEDNLRTSSVAYINDISIHGNNVKGKGHRKNKKYGEPIKLCCSIDNIKNAKGLIGAKYKEITIFGKKYPVEGSKSIAYKTIQELIEFDKVKFDNVFKIVPTELVALIRGVKKTDNGREIASKMVIEDYVFESKFNALKFLELISYLMINMGINPEKLEIEYIPAYDA